MQASKVFTNVTSANSRELITIKEADLISLFSYIGMKKYIILVMALIAATACNSEMKFSKSDKQIIRETPQEILKVYTIESEEETSVLRAQSTDLSKRSLLSKDYELLVKRMIQTVSDTTVGGVGIAAPQIGINKRVVVVQRFDREGEPFEAYPNISILEYSEDTRKGPEGCLSVPDQRYDVTRSASVVISYYDVESHQMVTETIEGFTAVIFQHEVDHLNGIIYTDRVLM